MIEMEAHLKAKLLLASGRNDEVSDVSDDSDDQDDAFPTENGVFSVRVIPKQDEQNA